MTIAAAPQLNYAHSDGGRLEAGFVSDADNDSFVRAVAIATGMQYTDVWKRVRSVCDFFFESRVVRRLYTPDDALPLNMCKGIMTAYGWRWTACQFLGSCVNVHLLPNELPTAPIVCRVSKGWVAVRERTAFNIEDPRRDGTRLVYGYFKG